MNAGNIVFKSVTISAMLAGALAVSACAPARKEFLPDKDKPKVFSVSFRQLPPEPVYARLRWVHLPQVLPASEQPQSGAGLIAPVMHVEFKNASLEEVTRKLAEASRYHSYCASSVAGKTITINMLGTLEEVLAKVSEQASAQAIVDHENRAISMLAAAAAAYFVQEQESTSPAETVAPRFAE